MRRAAKVDANQPAIIDALRRVGCSVQSLAAVGDGVPDLLVWSPRVGLLLIEVKNPEEHSGEVRRHPWRALTPDQVTFHRLWRGPIAIVWDVSEALRAAGVEVANV